MLWPCRDVASGTADVRTTSTSRSEGCAGGSLGIRSFRNASVSRDDRVGVCCDPQPLRARSRWQGVQADGAGDQAWQPSVERDDHLALLGVLNSSVACFWLKQVCQHEGWRLASVGVIDDEAWEDRYEHQRDATSRRFRCRVSGRPTLAGESRHGCGGSVQLLDELVTRLGDARSPRRLAQLRRARRRADCADDLAAGGARLAGACAPTVSFRDDLPVARRSTLRRSRLVSARSRSFSPARSAAGRQRRRGLSGTARRRSPRSRATGRRSIGASCERRSS